MHLLSIRRNLISTERILYNEDSMLSIRSISMKHRIFLRKFTVLLFILFGIEVLLLCVKPFFYRFSNIEIIENVLTNIDYLHTEVVVIKLTKEQIQSQNVISQIEDGTPIKSDGLSVYIWMEICTPQLEMLKAYPGFPLYPDRQTSTLSLNIQYNFTSFGLRIFGFLVPDSTGEYQFKIVTNNVSDSELWLSTGSSPKGMKLIARTDSSLNIEVPLVFQESGILFLESGVPYSIEILYLASEGVDGLTIYWRGPEDRYYGIIDQKFLAHYPINIVGKFKHLNSHLTRYHTNPMNDPREKIPLLNPLPLDLYPTIFPECDNNTYKLYPKEIETYAGLWSLFEDEVFLPNSSADQSLLYGAPPMNEEEARDLVKSFLFTIQNNDYKFRDFTLLNLEKSLSDVRESKYLLEGKVRLNYSPRESYMLFQTIHVENGSFCSPKIAPNLTAFVHIVIIVKDQRRWLRYFLENVNKIYEQTNDKQFGVIIVDFNSKDLRVDQLMKHTLKLKHYKYIPMDGAFNKVRGQNMAISSVLNPNEIIFTCDLQLNIPINMIDSIRKHTTQGISVYTPLLRRLNCGVIAFDGPGMWEIFGYGLVSMFKTDWEAIGGMSVEFGEKWGGEDWDLVDRVLRVGYHIHRLRMPSLVHFHHLREGAWYVEYDQTQPEN